MKKSLLLTTLVLIVMASTLMPSDVFASPAGPSSNGETTVEFGKSKEVVLTVANRTGGALIVMIAGPQSYTFYIMEQGKKKITGIIPGKYRVVLRSSACAGTVIYSKNIMGGTSLRPVYCKNFEGTLWLSDRR